MFISCESIARLSQGPRYVHMQGRNFGLKSGVPIQKENEAPLGPEAKAEENGEEISLLIRLSGSVRAS